MKMRGASTEPWGTTWDRGAVQEEQLLMSINCVSPVKEIQIDPEWL